MAAQTPESEANFLQVYLADFFGIPAAHLEQIQNFFQAERISKGGFHSKQGGNCDRLSFVKSGMLRMHRLHGDREITHWISGPGYFVVDLNSFLFAQPSRFDIQALSDCEVYTIYKRDYDRIGDEVPEWNELEKRFMAKCFAMLEERMFAQISLSAAERYAMLEAQQPELIREVPLHYLASMLGMSAETLSRVRAKGFGE